MNNAFLVNAVAEYPEVAALVVLVLGFFLAKLAEKQIARLLSFTDRLAARYTTSEVSLVSPGLVRATRTAVYWLVVLLALVLALRLLGVHQLSDWAGDFLDYVPRVLVGLAIIGVGNIVGLVTRYLMVRLGEQVETTSFGPRLLHATILIIATVMGLQYMQIDITFLTQLVLILVLVLGGGLALAFALGSRQYVANLVAQAELSRYSIGERVRVDGIEGSIVEISRGSISLDSTDGVVVIPGARFLETNVVRLPVVDTDE